MARRPKIYTKTGDDGSTGLLFGGRVRKDDVAPSAGGDVDEAQAAIGVARAVIAGGSAQLDAILLAVCRDLWVLMADLATAPDHRDRLVDGTTSVSAGMVERLEQWIDDVAEQFEPPAEFVVPGEDLGAAQLDLARTVVRRAERSALAAAADNSHAVAYLNRLSDLLWTVARRHEGESLAVRDV